jgi:hypothetical protein
MAVKAWSHTIREERRLRVFENRILMRIFWPRKNSNGEWRRFHNEELRNFNGIPTGNRPLGRLGRRWEDNIIMDIKEIGVNTRDLVDSSQDSDYWIALVNAALNLRVS